MATTIISKEKLEKIQKEIDIFVEQLKKYDR